MARSSITSRLSWRRRHFAPESLMNPLDPAVLSLVQALLAASKEIASCKKPSLCQRINAKTIAWRVNLLTPLFEEIRDSGAWVPPSALLAFRQLRVTFRNIKAIFQDCRRTSNLLLLMDQDVLAGQFCTLTHSIASALACLPCELLDVSQEVCEQAALVQRHAASSLPFIDPDEKALQVEVLSVMAQFETETSPDPAALQHIFDSLGFHDAFACEKELSLLEKEKVRLRDDNQLADIPNINNLLSFVRYARCILYGLAPQQLAASSCTRYDLSSPSMRRLLLAFAPPSDDDPALADSGDGGLVNVPDDFRCPISLDLMVDPVIIATGQTYERVSITRWLEEGHTTCPKSGMKLFHNDLIPNCNLRRLITQWCAENDYVLEPADKAAGGKGVPKEEVPNSKAALEATKLTAGFLVRKLESSSVSAEVQRQAAYELRLLAKEGIDNRACIASAGAVPALGRILASTPDPKTQENAVTALLNLSINDNNRSMIMEERVAVEAIVRTLSSGLTLDARENAAAALFSLTAGKDHRFLVGAIPGALPGLLGVVQEARARGKKDAAASLFNIALHGEHAVAMVSQHAAMEKLVGVLRGSDGDTVAAEVVALIALLARKGLGLAAVCDLLLLVVPEMVRLASNGTAKSKEHVVSLLLAASARRDVAEGSGAATTAACLRQELRRHPALLTCLQRMMAGDGSSQRAQQKAASLLNILQRYHASNR